MGEEEERKDREGKIEKEMKVNCIPIPLYSITPFYLYHSVVVLIV